MAKRLCFYNGQVLRVVHHVSFPDLNGTIGHVVRVCSGGDKAWIATREPLPDNRASFPKGDPRRNHLQIYFDEVEEA